MRYTYAHRQADQRFVFIKISQKNQVGPKRGMFSVCANICWWQLLYNNLFRFVIQLIFLLFGVAGRKTVTRAVSGLGVVKVDGKTYIKCLFIKHWNVGKPIKVSSLFYYYFIFCFQVKLMMQESRKTFEAKNKLKIVF